MTSLDGPARLVGRLGCGVTLAARTLLPVDTNPVPAEWTHITKVDPDVAKKLPLLYPLYLQHTSAVSVGGSADVTASNTEATFDMLAPASVPVFHEPSGARHVTPQTREQADLLAIPEVLNGDSESLVGTLGAGTEYIREEMVPDLLADDLPWLPDILADPLADFATSWLLAEAVFEAYIVQNPDSAAARESNVSEADLLSAREAKQRAMAAERHLESELVYVEYSGTYGGEEASDILNAVSEGLSWSRLWYGGGLDSRDHAQAMLDAGADGIVVGDVFHRIANEEATLCEQAARTLDRDATTDAVRNWIRETVAIDETNAAAYLATIPAVANPNRLAEAYLTATIGAWLSLREASDHGNSDHEDTATASVALDGLLRGEVKTDFGNDDTELIRRCFRALLAADDSDEIATDHFAVSLSSE